MTDLTHDRYILPFVLDALPRKLVFIGGRAKLEKRR
jgi:hypothetical protein